MISAIDLNCDVGESFGNFSFGADEAIMPFLTSANVACGFHAGDPLVMERTVALATLHKVAVGVHWGLPDIAGFGRRRMALTPDEIHTGLIYQMGALEAFASLCGTAIDHAVPHGALYPMLATDEALAKAAVQALCSHRPDLALYWPTPLQHHRFYEYAIVAGLRVIPEFAVDLEYAADGSLIIERTKKAVDISLLKQRLERLFQTDTVLAHDGTSLRFPFRALLMHGDAPNAAEVAATCREQMSRFGIEAMAATLIPDEHPQLEHDSTDVIKG